MPRKRSKKTIKKKRPQKEAHVEVQKKLFRLKKSYLIVFTLIAIFCLVLFFNSYFNYTSGMAFNPTGETLGTRFFLSGPDPYYNMRLSEITMETGSYPFVALSDGDPLLNYPVGVFAGARPPLFNMLTVASANIVGEVTGMESIDALGWCMLFLPAIYGALLVFPVYGIGKELFNKKAGLIAAFFLPLIPLHVGSGHGSSFSLFDHDSFLILLFTCLFLFMVKAFKSEDRKKQILYACLAGVVIGAVKLTWAVSHTIFIMLIIYLFIQFFFDIFKKEFDIKVPLVTTVAFSVGALISLPYIITTANQGVGIIMVLLKHFIIIGLLLSLGVLSLYLILKKLNLPWIVSLPSLIIMGFVGLAFLWYVNINQATFPIGVIVDISNVIYGSGIYGTQVSLTIGEAHTYGISQTILGFGPALYWVALTGFILFLHKIFIDRFKPEMIFIAVIFIIQFWMTTAAGRFLNDLVPLLLVFSGYMIWMMINKIDFKQIKTAFHNFRGLKKFKAFRPSFLFVILFVCFILILPNSFLAMDAAVPPQLKQEMFGNEHNGAYGLSLGQQIYWADACYWLSQQDTEIEKDEDKPGVITWWDYGFYLASMSEHPTVADNYQQGLRCAGNFHTSQNELESVSVLIIRLVEGAKEPKKRVVGTISEDMKTLFRRYLQPYNETQYEYDDNGNVTNEWNKTIYPAEDLINIVENPIEFAPSYDTLIAPEWGNNILREDEWNAMYHDATDILMTLSDEEITELHHEIMELTGYEIRYYGIEQRDMYTIFGVFPFLSDKGTHGYTTMEDDWFKTVYVDRVTGKSYDYDELINLTAEERKDMDLTTTTERKESYFNSMAYKTYFGVRSQQGGDRLPDNRVPCYLLKHWKAEYITPYISIGKYYEGVPISGTAKVGGINYEGSVVYVIDENQIPHDYSIVSNGKFSVIGLAGNTTLKLFTENNLVDEIFVGEISEEEATWKVESNYTANFNVNYSTANVNVSGLDSVVDLNITGRFYTTYKNTEKVFNGKYHFDTMIPSRYEFALVNATGGNIATKEVYLKPGDNFIDIVVGEFE